MCSAEAIQSSLHVSLSGDDLKRCRSIAARTSLCLRCPIQLQTSLMI
jgi:hypothetical protein